VLDSETGLMLYRNRYYHTGLGRFVTRDPMGYGSGDYNLLRYVRNRSLMTLDSFGYSAKDTFISALISGKIDATQREISGRPNVPLESAKLFSIDRALLRLLDDVGTGAETGRYKFDMVGQISCKEGEACFHLWGNRFEFPPNIRGITAIHEAVHGYNHTKWYFTDFQKTKDENLARAFEGTADPEFAFMFARWEAHFDEDCPLGNEVKLQLFMDDWNHLWTKVVPGLKVNAPEQAYWDLDKYYGIRVSCENYRAWSMEKIKQQWSEQCSVACIVLKCPDSLWSVFK